MNFLLFITDWVYSTYMYGLGRFVCFNKFVPVTSALSSEKSNNLIYHSPTEIN